MDIQMPEMDGLTATREIRKTISAEVLPIIAMTAHAVKGEYEKSIAAGMNDHITKPIDPDVLYRALVRFTKGLELKENGAPTISNSVASIKIQGVSYDEGLKRSGSKIQSYHALLLKFAGRYVNVSTDVRTKVMSSDMDGLIEYLHTLAGVSGNVGASEVFEMARKLSVQLKSSKDSGESKIRVDMISQMQLLTVKMENVMHEIREKVPAVHVSTSNQSERSEVNWKQFVGELRKLLAESDAAGSDRIEKVLGSASSEDAHYLNQIQQALADVEFENAEAILDRAIVEGRFSN
jgi:CheY-like chemotaxis protein